MLMKFRRVLAFLLLAISMQTTAHPLRLSLSEIEYTSESKRLTVSLRLFLMDVNEALVFDPESTELAFCQPNEAENAEPMLVDYLNQFFHIKTNGKLRELIIKNKRLHGEGINEAIGIEFEFQQAQPLKSLEIKNAVFTDLFFDQSNIVYVYVDDESESLMLNKETPRHRLEF